MSPANQVGVPSPYRRRVARAATVLFLLPLVLHGPLAAQEKPAAWYERTELSGLAYMDFYWVAASHLDSLEDRTGFWFRRIYVTLDQDLGQEFSLRLRLEMNSPGDFTSAVTADPFVKDAYLRWQRDRHEVVFGLSPSPTFDFIESFWGYRPVEKTVGDLQKLSDSRDLGIAARGSLDRRRLVRYHFQAGNGSGTKGETNEGKKAALSLGLHTPAGLVVQGYADFEGRPGGTDRHTVQGFVGYRAEAGRVGVQVGRQVRDVPGGPDTDLDYLSAFGAVRLRSEVSLLARFDRLFDPNPEGPKIAYLPFAATAKSNLLIAGLDLRLHESIHIIPNIEYIFYDAVGEAGAPGDDAIPRLTVFYRF